MSSYSCVTLALLVTTLLCEANNTTEKAQHDTKKPLREIKLVTCDQKATGLQDSELTLLQRYLNRLNKSCKIVEQEVEEVAPESRLLPENIPESTIVVPNGNSFRNNETKAMNASALAVQNVLNAVKTLAFRKCRSMVSEFFNNPLPQQQTHRPGENFSTPCSGVQQKSSLHSMTTRSKAEQRQEHQRRQNVPRSPVLPALAVSKENHMPAAAAKIISRIRSAPNIGTNGSSECGRTPHSILNSAGSNNYQQNERNKEGEASFQQTSELLHLSNPEDSVWHDLDPQCSHQYKNFPELDFQSLECLDLGTSVNRNIGQQKLQPFQQLLSDMQTKGTSNSEQQESRVAHEKTLSSAQYFEPKSLSQDYSNFRQLEGGSASQSEARSLEDEQHQPKLLAFAVLASFLRDQSQEETSAAQAGLTRAELHYSPIASSLPDQQQQPAKLAFSKPVLPFSCTDGILQRKNSEETQLTAHRSGQLNLPKYRTNLKSRHSVSADSARSGSTDKASVLHQISGTPVADHAIATGGLACHSAPNRDHLHNRYCSSKLEVKNGKAIPTARDQDYSAKQLAENATSQTAKFLHQKPKNTRMQEQNSLPREILKACILHRMKKMNDTNSSIGQPLSDRPKSYQHPQRLHSELEKQTNLLANLSVSAGFCIEHPAVQPVSDFLTISRNPPTQDTGVSADNALRSHEEACARSVLSGTQANLLDPVISSTLQIKKPNLGQVPAKTKGMESDGEGQQTTPDMKTIKQIGYQLLTAKSDLDNAAGHSYFASHQDVVGQPEVLPFYDFDNAVNCAVSSEFQEGPEQYLYDIFEAILGLKNSTSHSQNASTKEKSTMMTNRKKKIEGEDSSSKKVKIQHIFEQDLSPGNATFLQL